jgi:phosphoglycerate dehydrogenase-like enzyme
MARLVARIHAHVGIEHAAELEGRLAAAGREVVVLDDSGLERALGEIEVLVGGVLPRVDWSRATRLRLLQLLGSGIDTLWPATGLRAEAAIANARGIHLPEMRDHVLALMLAIERDLPRFVRAQDARAWRPRAGGTLGGKTAVILGLGEVGRSLAAACSALGMRVLGVRGRPQPTPSVDEVHGPDALHDVLARADHVVVVVPLTPATRGMLSKAAIARIPRGGALVNVARGGIVDEAALADALREGRLRAAALDVFEDEPLPATSRLWSAPNLIVTPHVAGWSHDYLARALEVFLENLRRLEQDEPLLTPVDRERRY